jgi:hypothetical protein
MYEVHIYVLEYEEDGFDTIDTISLTEEIASYLLDMDIEELVFETFNEASFCKNYLLENYPFLEVEIVNQKTRRKRG